jgi:uncharacterized protein (DUF169 family)
MVPASKQACHVGESALGIVPTPEKVSSGELRYNLRMFETQEAAKNMIAKRPTIEMGSVAATLVSTLSKAKIDPDAVVVTGMPEQIHWLMPVAVTYNSGGRKCGETASFQATCVDATIFHI